MVAKYPYSLNYVQSHFFRSLSCWPAHMTFSKACLCFCSVNIVLVVFAVVLMERDVLISWQGRYEILSLSGSYLLQDTGGGGRQRTGGLSVSLAGTDGRVIGGGVAGLLVAASPIQVGYEVDGCLPF